MRFSSQRFHRPNLRPQLKTDKRIHDQMHRSEKNTPPGGSASERHEPDVVQADLPGSNRLSRPVRPAIREILIPSTGAAALDGEWQQVKEPARSSASIWAMILLLLIALVWGAGLLVGFQTSLAVLLGLGLILTIVGLVSPPLGLLAIGMVAALDAMANIFLLTGGLLRYNTLNYFLILVILLNIPLILRMNDLPSRALQVLLLLMALELIFSEDISNGVQDILNIGTTFGMVVYFARALKDELSLYWLGVVNGLLTGLGGLVFFLQMGSLPYANPNDWTYFPMTGLFSICISYPFAVKYHKSRLILLILAMVNFAWIFLSASRGSLLVAMVALAFLFFSTRSITWKSVMVAIVVGISVWVSASFAEQQLSTITRIEELFDPTLSPTRRTSQRSAIAEAGWQIFQKNPMGAGTGSFEVESIKTGLVGSNRPAHSAWVQVLAENGVLGIILMITFIGSYTIVGLRKQSEGRLVFALFITLVLASAFIAKEFRGKSLWFLAASGIVLLQPKAILAYLNIKERKESNLNGSRRIRSVRYSRKK